MRIRKTLSILLALAILLSCIGWTPTQAEEATKETGFGAVTENIQTQSPDEGSNILQYVDEEEFHSHDHVARLREEERHDTYVFLNRDGTKTVYYMGRDVKYTDRNGQIREKDTTLVRGQGGYGMRDNDVLLHLPDEAGSGIRLSHGERGVRLIPQGGSGSATLADNSITYQNYFGRGIHLRYTPMLSGVKEDIILTKYTGQNSFTFTLETGGLTLFASEGQYYLAESEGAEAAFYLGEIVVYDAMGKPDLGTMTVETVTAGQSYRLTVSADADFLTDPETRYPVTIDPTLTISDNIIGAGSIEDAPVFQNYPNRNFGTYVYNSMGYVDDTFGMAKTVVRLNGLLGNGYYCQIAIDQIESMTFHVKCAGTSYAMIDLFALTENSEWAEDTVTWNNLGPYTTTAYDSQSVGGNAWSSFDITELAKDWLRGTPNGQCGFVLISQSNTTRTSTISCETTNTDNRPYVEFTYKNAVTINPAETEIYVGETTTLTATTIPVGQAVTWTSSDTEIAEVDENGVVTGIAPGTVTITARVDENTAAQCEVTVQATRIWLDAENLTLGVGESCGITATTEPLGLHVYWYSADSTVAVVDEDGHVTAVGTGVANILANLEDGTTAVCEVNVVEKQITLNQTVLDLVEGTEFTLSATTVPANRSVTWTSSDTSVATVSNGKVLGKKAGVTTITASMHGGPEVTCKVHVTIEDGVYYIQNLHSGYYLHVSNGEITNFADVYQCSRYLSTTSNVYKIRQMWKICYLGDGRYSIRPMHKLDMGLDVTGSNVDIYKIGTDDTLSTIPSYAEWTISWYSTGYVFKNNDRDSLTMQIENASTSSGAAVVASTYSTSENCQWGLMEVTSPPAGAYLYDTAEESIIATVIRDVYIGTTKSLSTLQLSAVAYSGTTINQSFTWYSSNDAIATVDSNGEVTGVSSGKATITGRVYRNGAYYYVSYTICVGASFETTMTKLGELYDVALEYNSTPHDAALLTMQFIRRLKYNSGAWPTVAGAVDSQFVDYVEVYHPSLYDYFTIESSENYYYLDPNGGGYIDFTHLCATMNGLLYDSEGFKAAMVGEGNINNLCGWAGDLQTLCMEVLDYTSNSNDYDAVYSATYDMIGDEAHSLSMMDLLADTDAYNVYQLLNSSSSNFISAFTTYYDDYVGTRYTRFTNGWSKQTIYNCVRKYTTNTFSLGIDWPLLEGYDISDTQANAIASAFTDFIWEEIQNEQ